MIVTVCLNPTIQKTEVFSRIIKGAVNRAHRQYTDASGKGVNVSRVLAQLGQSVTHITQLGGAQSDFFAQKVAEAHIKLCAVQTEASLRTCCTLIETEGDSLCVTELVEEGERVSAETERAVRNAFLQELKSGVEPCRAVVISGSKAPGFSDSLFPDLVFESLAAHIPVVADYRGKDLLQTLQALKTAESEMIQTHAGVACTSLSVPLVIKPNFDEFCATFFVDRVASSVTEQELESAMSEISHQYRCALIVTNGEEPLIAFDGTRFYHKNRSPLPEGARVQNTIGCGDAFTAGFTAALVQNVAFEDALDEGCRCGALNAATIRPGSILMN